LTAGAPACTRMRRLATSLATAFVSPMTPAFAAEYGTSVGFPSFPAIEAMLMMRPRPAASITRTAARETRNTLVRSPAMTRCQSSSLSSQVGTVRPVMPALLTTMSSRCQRSTTARTIRSTSAVFVTSAATATASAPIRAAAASAAGPSTSATATRAPSVASRAAIAYPIPRAAPVTSAVLPMTDMVDLLVGPASPPARAPSASARGRGIEFAAGVSRARPVYRPAVQPHGAEGEGSQDGAERARGREVALPRVAEAGHRERREARGSEQDERAHGGDPVDEELDEGRHPGGEQARQRHASEGADWSGAEASGDLLERRRKTPLELDRGGHGPGELAEHDARGQDPDRTGARPGRAREGEQVADPEHGARQRRGEPRPPFDQRHGDRVGPGGEPADGRRQHAADARREEGEHEAGDDRRRPGRPPELAVVHERESRAGSRQPDDRRQDDSAVQAEEREGAPGEVQGGLLEGVVGAPERVDHDEESVREEGHGLGDDDAGEARDARAPAEGADDEAPAAEEEEEGERGEERGQDGRQAAG